MAGLRWAAAMALFAALRLAAGAPPHVVLLVMDDVGWADVGYHGSDFPTPHIDELASSGVRLERMYVMPQCSPTRAAIMTGRYSFRTGLQHFSTITPGARAGIPEDVSTLAETFKAAGYATHMVGKWHLGSASWHQTPTGRGFDSHYGYLLGQTQYYNRTVPTCAPGPMCMYPTNRHVQTPFGADGASYDFWDGRRPVYEDVGRYTVDAYEERIDQILRPYGAGEPAKPLFLYYAEQQLHIPLQAPPEARYLETCRGVVGGEGLVNRTVLCSMASRLDDSVGRLVRQLRKYGMWQSTLIFAMTDNGGMTSWGHDWPASGSSNWPLRGGKTTVFEGGVRAVAFVSGGALPAAVHGTRRHDLLHAVDVLPTLAGFAGLPPALVPRGDGVDAWPAIAGGAPVNRTELPLQIGVNPLGGMAPWVPGYPKDGHLNYSALISWPWKVMVGETYITARVTDDRRRDGWWSVAPYVYHAPPDERFRPVRLYNLEEDEREEHNLAGTSALHDGIAATLVRRVEFYASPTTGWVKPQHNMPDIRGNPRWHNWTWAPFLRHGSAQSVARDDAPTQLFV